MQSQSRDACEAAEHECDAVVATQPVSLTKRLVATGSLTSAEIDAAVSERAASGAPMYEVDVEHLLALEPDLVVSQSLCDVCALPANAVERVLADAAPQGRERPRVVCLEWLDPPYICGHWIPEMMDRAGGIDLFGRPGIPSVAAAWSDSEAAHPPTVIAMPCGYDLARAQADVDEMSRRDEWQRAIGDARVFAAAGGAYFTRPGPKLVTGIEVLAAVLHPDAVAWPIPTGVIGSRT